MKNYLLVLSFSLSFSANAQNIWQKMTVSFRTGAIFSSYENYNASYYDPYRLDTHNHWSLELGVEENKFGLGLTARYITYIRGFIENPIYRKSSLPQNIKIGDLTGIGQDLSGFTFFANKRLFVF